MRNVQVDNSRIASLLCIFAIPLLYAVGCLGQGSAAAPAQTAFGHMVITVRDSSTGYAVPASLHVEGQRTLTLEADNAGRVTLQLPAGEYAITISAAGYKTMRLGQNLAAVANQNGTVYLDPEKVPEEERPDAVQAHVRAGYTVLHGFVVDEVGKPLSGVTVRLGSGETNTDARGHYFVSVPTPPMTQTGAGALTLTFEKPGYRTIVIENFKVNSDNLGEVPIGMKSGSGEIRQVAPEPGGSTGAMDPSQKGQTGISSELYRWVHQAARNEGTTGIIVPANIVVGTGGPDDPLNVYEPCPLDANHSSRHTCTYFRTFTLEYYVTHGLPAEWLNWWDINSQMAGAVAYRSYGAWFVANKACPYVGAYGECPVAYDICNTTSCQVYDPHDSPTSKTSVSAVNGTTGTILSQDGTNAFYAEYAAETNWASDQYATCDGQYGDGYIGEPNYPGTPWPCMYDLVGKGHSQPSTHSRGMSQRGSQRWATANDWTGGSNDTHNPILNSQGQQISKRDWRCILDHYYNANSNSVTVDPNYYPGVIGPGTAGTLTRTAFLQNQPTYGSVAYEAYDSHTGSLTGIRVANAADGSGDKSIASGYALYPSWEPGGARLAYANASGIVVANADGTNPVPITSNACPQGTAYNCDFAPAWSPISGRIAFCSIRSNPLMNPPQAQVWIMNADGSNLQQLTTSLNLGDDGLPGRSIPPHEQLDCYLSWSPDESKIAVTGITAYLPNPPMSRYNVYEISATDGSVIAQLTDCHLNYNWVSDCGLPSWSPDGMQIAYSDDDTVYGDNYAGAGIYTITPDGSAWLSIFLQSSWHDWFPHYSTDGKTLLYTADPNVGPWSIYSRSADGLGSPTTIIDGSGRYPTQGSFDCSKCQSFAN